MKQMSLDSTATGFERKTKRTRKREFLDEMNLVVPWAELVALITPFARARNAKGGRPPFAVETMLRYCRKSPESSGTTGILDA